MGEREHRDGFEVKFILSGALDDPRVAVSGSAQKVNAGSSP
jgi:hypothetical protein